MELPETHPPRGNVHHHPLLHLCPHHHHHHQHPHHHPHHPHQFGGHNSHPCIHHNLTSHPNHFNSFPNLPPPATIPCGLQFGTSVTVPGTLNVETSFGSKEQQGLDHQFVPEEFQLEEQAEEEEPMYVMTDEWLEFFAKSEAKRKLEKQQAKLKKKQARNAASKAAEEARNAASKAEEEARNAASKVDEEASNAASKAEEEARNAASKDEEDARNAASKAEEEARNAASKANEEAG